MKTKEKMEGRRNINYDLPEEDERVLWDSTLLGYITPPVVRYDRDGGAPIRPSGRAWQYVGPRVRVRLVDRLPTYEEAVEYGGAAGDSSANPIIIESSDDEGGEHDYGDESSDDDMTIYYGLGDDGDEEVDEQPEPVRELRRSSRRRRSRDFFIPGN